MNIAEIKTKVKNHKIQIIDTKRSNAVLVPLIENEEGVCILFETRSQNVWQPGEVCFPGGGIEYGESGSEAAIRECCEELGIAAEDIELISSFDIMVALGGFVVNSYIGQLKATEFKIDENEVAEVFTVPLKWFMENKPQIYEFPLEIKAPDDFDYSVFGIEGKYNWRKGVHRVVAWKYKSHYIWGITAKILLYLVDTLRKMNKY